MLSSKYMAYMPTEIAARIAALGPKPFAEDLDTVELLLKPTGHMSLLRSNLWKHLRSATEVVQLFDVCSGIMPMNRCIKLMERWEFVVYICTPPMDNNLRAADALECSLKRMREILDYPVRGTKGELDTKVIAQQMKVYEMLSKYSAKNVEADQPREVRVSVQGQKEDSLDDIDQRISDAEKMLEGGSFDVGVVEIPRVNYRKK